MADLLKRLKISEQQYGVGMEDNPFQDVSNDEAMKVCFGGSGGGSPPPPPPTTMTQQTSNIPEYFQPYLERLFDRSEAVTTEPFQRYEGQRLAEFTPEQQAAYSGVEGLVGDYKPYLASADLLTAQASQQSTDPTAIAARMNPYQQAVIDIQKREALRDAEKLQQQIGAQAVGAGAFGGSRQALIESELARQQGQRLADIQAVGSQQAYDTAMEQLAADRAASLAAGQQFATLGGQQQQLGLAGLGALETVGGTRQSQQQKALDIAYEDFARETTRPSQQVQEMSSVLRGFNLPVSTYTTQQSQVQQPGLGQQLLGAGLGVYGLGSQFGLFKDGGIVNKFDGGDILAGSRKYGSSLFNRANFSSPEAYDLFEYTSAPLTGYEQKFGPQRKIVSGVPTTKGQMPSDSQLKKLVKEGKITPRDISIFQEGLKYYQPGEEKTTPYKEFEGTREIDAPMRPPVEDIITQQEIEQYDIAQDAGGFTGEDTRPRVIDQQTGYGQEFGPPKPPPVESRIPEILRPPSKEIKLSTNLDNINFEDIVKSAPTNVETTFSDQTSTGSIKAPEPAQQTPEEYAASAVSPLRDEIKNIREKYDSNVDLKKVEGEGMPKDIIAQIGLALMTRDESVSGDILSQIGSRVGQFMPEIQKRKERREDKAERAAERAEDQEFKLMGLEADVTGREAEIASRERISQRDNLAKKEQLGMQIANQNAMQKREIRAKADESAKNRKMDLLQLKTKQDYDQNYLTILKSKNDAEWAKLTSSQNIEMAKLELQDQLMEMERNKITLEQSAASEKTKLEARKADMEQLSLLAKYVSDLGLDPDDPLRKIVDKQIVGLYGSGIPGVK
tara:strand:- start:1218 stop:3746 length:2529 start_codon:yes stop_codon:yes gene_type:complete